MAAALASIKDFMDLPLLPAIMTAQSAGK